MKKKKKTANKEGGSVSETALVSAPAGEYSGSVSSNENLGTIMVPTAFSTGMTQPLDPAEARDGILPKVVILI